MRTIAVIGKNFGDEGKGLAVDFLARDSKKTMIVRHNGGSQSGHTVEYKDTGGKRFVYHSLSSGSFRRADTLWINSFYPDLFKLGEEIKDFRNAFGFIPRIYAAEDTCITVPDDVLINMALETSRGSKRHGSCGMGINECDLRTGSGNGLRLGDVSRMSADNLYKALSRLRAAYTSKRLKELNLSTDTNEYTQLLSNENVLKNASLTITRNTRYVEVLSEKALKEKLKNVETLIFETGQGLLLDSDNKEYQPHVTASHTGLVNPCGFLEKIGQSLDEVIYVSRTYVTRHGAGALPGECPKSSLGLIERDKTNEPNEWQGKIRYAAHENENGFVSEVNKDLCHNSVNIAKVSLFLTHLNETGNSVVMKDRRIPVESFVRLKKISDTFESFYLSDSRFSEDVRIIKQIRE